MSEKKFNTFEAVGGSAQFYVSEMFRFQFATLNKLPTKASLETSLSLSLFHAERLHFFIFIFFEKPINSAVLFFFSISFGRSSFYFLPATLPFHIISFRRKLICWKLSITKETEKYICHACISVNGMKPKKKINEKTCE